MTLFPVVLLPMMIATTTALASTSCPPCEQRYLRILQNRERHFMFAPGIGSDGRGGDTPFASEEWEWGGVDYRGKWGE